MRRCAESAEYGVKIKGRDSTSLFSVDPGDECLVFDARDVLMVIFSESQ